MKIAARVLSIIVALGGIYGLLGLAGSLYALSQTGHLQNFLEGTAGIVFVVQSGIGALLNICAIALAPIVFFALEETV